MLIELKVKIKSLAVESRIIRKHERQALTGARISRVRAALEACGFNNAQVQRISRRAMNKLGRRTTVENTTDFEATKAYNQAVRAGPHDLLDTFVTQHQSLHHHRIGVVRPESRSAQLAYAALRGVPYNRVEALTSLEPNWNAVRTIAKRFGDQTETTTQAIEAWLDTAKSQRKLVRAVEELAPSPAA